MSERLRSMSDEDLGAALASLDIEWPSTPTLHARGHGSRRVGAARRSCVSPCPAPSGSCSSPAASVLLLAGAAVAAKIVIDLGGVVVEVTPGRPGPCRRRSGRSDRRTGGPLRKPRRLSGDDVPRPVRLGPPDRVWADEVFTEAGEVARVTLAWDARPDLPEISSTRYGAVLMVFEGDADLASKEVYEDTGVLQFETVDGVE